MGLTLSIRVNKVANLGAILRKWIKEQLKLQPRNGERLSARQARQLPARLIVLTHRILEQEESPTNDPRNAALLDAQMSQACAYLAVLQRSALAGVRLTDPRLRDAQAEMHVFCDQANKTLDQLKLH